MDTPGIPGVELLNKVEQHQVELLQPQQPQQPQQQSPQLKPLFSLIPTGKNENNNLANKALMMGLGKKQVTAGKDGTIRRLSQNGVPIEEEKKVEKKRNRIDSKFKGMVNGTQMVIQI